MVTYQEIFEKQQQEAEKRRQGAIQSGPPQALTYWSVLRNAALALIYFFWGVICVLSSIVSWHALMTLTSKANESFWWSGLIGTELIATVVWCGLAWACVVVAVDKARSALVLGRCLRALRKEWGG